MTETHKAAVEALDTMPSNRIYGGIKSATQFKKELGEWAFNNLDALRTLKQPSSVEVTVEGLDRAMRSLIHARTCFEMVDDKLKVIGFLTEEIDYVQSILRTLKQPSSVEVTEWQSIDTAPRDGTHILVYRPDVATFPDKDRLMISLIGSDYFEDGEWQESGINGRFQPAAWMPLPQQPSLRITRAAATDVVKS